MTRAITDVPLSKLNQVVKDLEYEVGLDNIRIFPQSNGFWLVEYSI